jgi:hypothetical protein
MTKKKNETISVEATQAMRARAPRYIEEFEGFREKSGHIDKEIDEGFAETLAALAKIKKGFDKYPADWAAPVKPPLRGYQRIKPGDRCTVREVYRDRTPTVLREALLHVREICDDLVYLVIDGDAGSAVYALGRRFLAPWREPAQG